MKLLRECRGGCSHRVLHSRKSVVNDIPRRPQSLGTHSMRSPSHTMKHKGLTLSPPSLVRFACIPRSVRLELQIPPRAMAASSCWPCVCPSSSISRCAAVLLAVISEKVPRRLRSRSVVKSPSRPEMRSRRASAERFACTRSDSSRRVSKAFCASSRTISVFVVLSARVLASCSALRSEVM